MGYEKSITFEIFLFNSKQTMLTGNKDVDRKILNELEDKDLVNVCQTNKKANSLCNDQVFWMNRVFQRFGYVGGDILRNNKMDRTWSEYYIKDLRKINKTNANKYLDYGSRDGRFDHVIIALKIGSDIHKKSDYGLRIASWNGHLEIVKYLISQGADIHANDDRALKWAIEMGQDEVVKFLIEKGANIHTNDDEALRWASYHGHLDMVKYLVSRGADIHANDDISLIWASRYGYLGVIKYLVSQGANIHAQNDISLRWASQNGHTEVVKYLKDMIAQE